jgi:hypothetical protein
MATSSTKRPPIPLVANRRNFLKVELWTRDGAKRTCLGLFPLPPVRGLHVDLPFGLGIDPGAKAAPAWKGQRMRAVAIKHGEF